VVVGGREGAQGGHSGCMCKGGSSRECGLVVVVVKYEGVQGGGWV
jgi:hypothetical protein